MCEAQESLVKIPKRAGMYSAIIPGAGQVYTKKYWKVPIIYAGLITSAYYFKENHDLYDLYKIYPEWSGMVSGPFQNPPYMFLSVGPIELSTGLCMLLSVFAMLLKRSTLSGDSAGR